MLGTTRLAVAAAVLALLTFGGCSGGTTDTDDWLQHQLPEDLGRLGTVSTASFGAGDGALCDELGAWADDVRDHPHPEDPLLADGWDAFLDVVGELAETCPTDDPARMAALVERYGDALTALTSRMRTHWDQTQ